MPKIQDSLGLTPEEEVSNIANELDAMLQGSDQTTASQAQNGGQGDDATRADQGQPIAQQTPEEIEFNSLTGSTQDRIKKLAKDKRELETRLQNLERTAGLGYIPPAPGSNFRNPDEEAAIRTLASKGIATDEKVNQQVDSRIQALRWELEQNRLESKYDGSRKTGDTSEPTYVREEVEDFITSHPQYRNYSAEDVFKYKMFPDEFLNIEVQSRGTRTGRTQTLRPTARTQASNDQGLSLEYIAERTDLKKYPDALEWQEEHKAEIDKFLQSQQA